MTTENLLKLCFWTLLVFLIGSLSSCSHEPGMKSALGEYTYRMSGTARIYDGRTDEACHVTLTPETGTMSVIRGNESDRGIIQVFADNGDTYELPVVFMHDTIYAEPMYRDISVKQVFDNKNDELFHICVAGEGFVLQNGALSVHLGYSGRSRNTEHEWTLTASDIHMNAKKL